MEQKQPKQETATQPAQQSEETKRRIALLKEDYENEWWTPSSVDNGSLRHKLLRVGCRPLMRKLLLCNRADMDVKNFATCKVSAGRTE